MDADHLLTLVEYSGVAIAYVLLVASVVTSARYTMRPERTTQSTTSLVVPTIYFIIVVGSVLQQGLSMQDMT